METAVAYYIYHLQCCLYVRYICYICDLCCLANNSVVLPRALFDPCGQMRLVSDIYSRAYFLSVSLLCPHCNV